MNPRNIEKRGSLHYSVVLSCSLAPKAHAGLGLAHKQRLSLHYGVVLSVVSLQKPMLVWAFCRSKRGRYNYSVVLFVVLLRLASLVWALGKNKGVATPERSLAPIAQSGLGLGEKKGVATLECCSVSSLASNAQKTRGSLHYSVGLVVVSRQKPMLVWALCRNKGGRSPKSKAHSGPLVQAFWNAHARDKAVPWKGIITLAKCQCDRGPYGGVSAIGCYTWKTKVDRV